MHLIQAEKIGAGNETRTRDPNLGKVVLYQLSYSRVRTPYSSYRHDLVKTLFYRPWFAMPPSGTETSTTMSMPPQSASEFDRWYRL